MMDPERFRLSEDRRILWAGERALPVVHAQVEDWETPFQVMRSRQALVGCENGWCLSIIWGSGSYRSNYPSQMQDDPFDEEPPDVEAAVLVPHRGEGLGELAEDPIGWVGVAEVVALYEMVGALGTRSAWPGWPRWADPE